MKQREGRDALQLYLPTELKAWLRGYAEQRDLSITTVIRFMLERERARERASQNGEELETNPFFGDIFA